jgi:hypothetical protein
MDEYTTATNGPVPSHKTFELDGVVLSSEFDSGNLLRAERKGENVFWLWTANDCMHTDVQTGMRTWFYFSVLASIERNLTFSVRNLNNHLKLFKEGFRPVVRIGNGPWRHIEGRYTYLAVGDGSLELTFT